jgi:hypothetical protein
MTDAITVLHSVNGRHAAKRFKHNSKTGQIKNRSYDQEKYFRIEVVELDNFDALAATLTRLVDQRHAFVVRGAPWEGINLKYARRLLHRDPRTGDQPTIKAVPRHWFAADVDHIDCPALTDPATDPDGAIEYVIGLLPAELHDASCWWQFTSSQSLPGHQDTLSVRLWYWSDELLDDAALKRWAAVVNRAGVRLVDPSLYNGAQAHYTARPLFENFPDPLSVRYGVRQGLEQSVSLIIPPPDVTDPELPSGQGYEPGAGVEAYFAQIGGPAGFRDPIKKAIASYIAINGGKADAEPLKLAIRTAIASADPGGRTADQLERYSSDAHLDDLIRWTREQHGDQPPKGFVPEPPPGFDEPPAAEPPDDEPDEDSPDTIIRVIGGLRHLAANAGMRALHENTVEIYQRGQNLAQVCKIKAKSSNGDIFFVPGIVRVSAALLTRELGRIARWEKFDRYQNLVRCDPPNEVVEQILAMIGEWDFEPLIGVVACPTLRPDGSLLNREGYDPATGLFLHNGLAMPPIADTPHPDDAAHAADLLCELLAEFPFVDEPSKSVGLSQLITPVARGAMPVVPLHVAKAPQPGTGKSYLADCASMITTGERCAVIAVAPNPEETEKRLIGAALAGNPVIALDNSREILQGDFLCQLTERPLLELRRLGSSDPIRVANTHTVFANGNNLAIADDMVRRTIQATLDANTENPEQRTFKANPLKMIRAGRGRYVAACLTIVRGYLAAGSPGKLPPIESYEEWSDLVRSALVWLGYADPVETMDTARGADPVREDRSTVFAAWRTELDVNAGYLAAELAELAECRYDYDQSFVRPTLRSALLAVADKHGSGGQIDTKRLGHWLKKNENTIVGGHKLIADRSDASRPRWRLRRVMS